MTTRRDFLKSSGMLVVGISAISLGNAFEVAAGQAAGAGPYPDPDFRQLDSWIIIREDNTATFYVGKTDLGQGTGTAFRQIMSDELDIAYDRTSCVMGRTDVTVDQGGSGGSDALQTDGWPMRRVAAEARRVLLEMASSRFGVPVSALVVSHGVISVAADPSRTVTYGDLIGGRKFNVTLSGKNPDTTTGTARLKTVQELGIVGQSPKRYDVPAKVDGSLEWAVDVKLPGMVHARNVRPAVAGATLVSIDESSVRDTPGFIRVVSKGNYVAVVCEREEQAVRAARQLKVNWRKPTTAPFPASEDLFAYMRSATPSFRAAPQVVGDPEPFLSGVVRRAGVAQPSNEAASNVPRSNVARDFRPATPASPAIPAPATSATAADVATVIEAEYEVPFQGHTALGPAHATADPSNDQLTIYSNDMKSYGLRRGVAEFLQMPRDRVRVVWMEGSQAYGRTAADDAGFEAAFLAKELGRPVRVQWTRQEETAWDTKGPAYAVRMRGALDAQGHVVALDYDACAADHNHLGYNEHDTVLISQLMGVRRAKPATGRASLPSEMYVIPNRRRTTAVVPLPLVWETPLRTGNLRDPDGPQVTFASESFIDELAAAASADPVACRLGLLSASNEDDAQFKRARSIACIKAAAGKFGWEPRPSPQPRGRGEILTGRGIAYAYRSQTVVAQIAEVEVNRKTGHIWVKRLVCAHDCGLVINPEALTRTLECGMLHSLSRALHEEVRFDTEKVTSVDWVSHPTMTHADTPATIDIVIVNGDPNPGRPDLPHYGAGEAVCKPTLAAVANAVFDATGVRLRRVPFRAERVLAALKTAGV